MIAYPIMPAIVRQITQYSNVQCFPRTVAVVWIFACLSACISGIAEYACIAIHRSVPVQIMNRLISVHPPKKYPKNQGMIYKILNIPSRNGIAFALIGLVE